MRIPKKIKIPGVTYKVRVQKEVENTFDDQVLLGQINFTTNKIDLREDLNREQLEITLLHELLHGIFNHCDLDQDEHTINLLANGLHMVLKDNPKLLKE